MSRFFCVAAAVPAALVLGPRSGRDGRRYMEKTRLVHLLSGSWSARPGAALGGGVTATPLGVGSVACYC